MFPSRETHFLGVVPLSELTFAGVSLFSSREQYSVFWGGDLSGTGFRGGVTFSCICWGVSLPLNSLKQPATKIQRDAPPPNRLKMAYRKVAEDGDEVALEESQRYRERHKEERRWVPAGQVAFVSLLFLLCFVLCGVTMRGTPAGMRPFLKRPNSVDASSTSNRP